MEIEDETESTQDPDPTPPPPPGIALPLLLLLTIKPLPTHPHKRNLREVMVAAVGKCQQGHQGREWNHYLASPRNTMHSTQTDI